MRIFVHLSLLILVSVVLHSNAAASPTKGGEVRQLLGGAAFGPARNYCPLCDSSVYSYCHEKIFHDGCCCQGQFGVQGSSYQCLHADCSYLHANSCQEHALIAECCCDD